jgi:hypothetical protein
LPIAQVMGVPIPDPIAPPCVPFEPEIGHFAEGARFDEMLLATAYKGAGYG